jgi:acetyl-CoA carboxylase beta subunit
MLIETTREIDQEWTEYTLTQTFADPSGIKVRYKAEMNGNHLVCPRLRGHLELRVRAKINSLF